MPDLDYFIDSHCHMFTMADIPLYKPLEQVVEDKDSLGTYTLLSLLIFARPFINPKKRWSIINRTYPFLNRSQRRMSAACPRRRLMPQPREGRHRPV